MIESGPTCVDERPAMYADGSQGIGLAWEQALALCSARGARLCTEYERESACPDEGPSRDSYCEGPNATWEWSDGQLCTEQRRISPCCTVAQGFGQCDDGWKQGSFRCCLTR